MEKIVIIGAGHGGVELANALRQQRFAGSVTLVSDETELPYHRPPLSKDFLKTGSDPLLLKAGSFYTQNAVDLKRGRRAVAIDRDAKTVRLDDGEVLAYDHLALALGARNRVLPIPGGDHPDNLELRDLAHAREILKRSKMLGRVVIVGGGFIGLEVAAFLREKGIAVDIVELADRLMARAVSPPVSEYFRRLHEGMGAKIHFHSQAATIAHKGGRAVLGLQDGRELAADAILVAAGIVPNVELAAAAGLKIENGILVDDRLLTSDPSISAFGDCAAFPCVYAEGRCIRLESVQNAVDQGRCIAKRLTGKSEAYCALPWFWSNQGTARLQIAGLDAGHDAEVIRGDTENAPFSVFLYRGDRLLAVESVNDARHHMLARKLLEAGTAVPREMAAKTDTDLKALLP